MYVVDGVEEPLYNVLSRSCVRRALDIKCCLDKQGFHIDPDFYTGTYGEYWKPYPIRRVLKKQGSIVMFFIGSFMDIDSCYSRSGWYLFGHMLINEYIDLLEWSPKTIDDLCLIIDKYGYNAHLVRSFSKRVLDVVGRDDLKCIDKLVYVLGRRENMVKTFYNKLRSNTKLLLKVCSYCIYRKSIRIWSSRDSLYSELLSRGVVVKQVLYSRVYSMVDTRKFIEWILSRDDI